MNTIIKDFFSVINVKTLIVIAAACTTTYICTELQFYYNVPTDLIGIAIVFPIVFQSTRPTTGEKRHLNIIQF